MKFSLKRRIQKWDFFLYCKVKFAILTLLMELWYMRREERVKLGGDSAELSEWVLETELGYFELPHPIM